MEFGGVFPAGRPHDVASLLKLFLRELPEPLLTRRFSKVFSDCTMISSTQDLVLVACLLLPLQHLQCLQFLMRFLQRLSTQSQANKMDLHCLAVAMTPNLFQLGIPDSVTDSQLNLTSYTSAVEHLISHAGDIGNVPNDVAKRAVQLSKEFDSNLPPLLLTFNGGREATDYDVRRSMRRIRRKNLVKGLGSSISRLRKTSPKKSSACQEAGSSSGTGSSMPVHRKESVKRRAECTSTGTNAKRRAVHQSPDNTPTSSKKGKRRSGLFRRKAKKGRHKGKSCAVPSPCHVVVHSLTDSDDQLINSPIDCSDSEAPTSISNLSRDDVETDLKSSSNGSTKESQFGRIGFGHGDSAAPTPSPPEYSYQVVTSDGTLVKCLSQAEKMNNSTLKFSEVQRKRAVSASTDTLVSAAPVGVTCLSHDRLEVEVMQSWDGISTPLVCKPASGFRGNKSHYQLRSSNLARQTAILPSKMRVIPTPTSTSRPAPVSTPSSKPSRLMGKSKSDCSIQGMSVSGNHVQGYDFTPFLKETSLDDHMAAAVDVTPRFTGGQAVERELISSAAVASQNRRSPGISIRQKLSAEGGSFEPPVSHTTGRAKLEKSFDMFGRRSLDSVAIRASSKGFSPSQDYHFSIPDERQRNSPTISPDSSNPEAVSEQNVGGFHFSAPQVLGMKEGGESVTSDRGPCSETNSSFKKLESGSCSLLPRDSIGQSCPLEAAVSPNLLEEISMEILERKKSEEENEIDEEFLLKCTKEEKKKKNGSPLARKIYGSHSRRNSSYRLALQLPTNQPMSPFRGDGGSASDPSHNCQSGVIGGDSLAETRQKTDSHLLPGMTSALLPRRRNLKMADDADRLTNRAEVYVMPVTSSRRDLGKPTSKKTGSSSSPIGYVKSQVKKFSDQFFQSPVLSSGTVPREPLRAISSQKYITSSTTVAKNSIRQVSKEWLV